MQFTRDKQVGPLWSDVKIVRGRRERGGGGGGTGLARVPMTLLCLENVLKNVFGSFHFKKDLTIENENLLMTLKATGSIRTPSN